MIKISNISKLELQKILKILKIDEIFCENLRIIFVFFYYVHKEYMFIISLEDGREAPYKAIIHILDQTKLSRIPFESAIEIYAWRVT